MRASGIPARDVYGLRVAPSRPGRESLGLSSTNATRARTAAPGFTRLGLAGCRIDVERSCSRPAICR
jgi:transglutaminase-like putative cysteine protease